MNCEEARVKIEAMSMEQFPNLFGNLNHYYDDADIRAKDQGYKEFQDGELKKLIHHLKSGDVEKANEISFLHES